MCQLLPSPGAVELQPSTGLSVAVPHNAVN